MDCKWYQDEFCVNAASPCVADYCPCVEYPELCRYYQSRTYLCVNPTYDELYEHWLKTAYKQKMKHKNKIIEIIPGQISFFDETKENNND
jgi:hypothetical protein